MQRRFLSNYRFWLLLGLLLAGWPASPAYAQEEGFFALLDEDRRREFTLELGPSFMEDPVFRSFTDASGVFHPATKVNLKTPRHISGTFGWRLNDWLRVQASINFNAADFSGASSANATQDDIFNQAVIRNLRNQDVPTDDNGICLAVFEILSVHCTVSRSVYTRLRADRERAVIIATPEYNDALDPDNMDDPCNEVCAIMRARTAIISDEDRIMELEASGMTGSAARLAFIRNSPEYAMQMVGDCNDACALGRAETAIRTDEDGQELLTNANTDTPEDAQQEAEQAAAAAEFSVDRQTYAAEGTFFSINSFLSAYADIPLTSGIWLYGGGGAGVSWSHVKEGFYRRDAFFNLTNADDIEENIESRLGLEADDLNVRFDLLENSRFQRTDIISTITSFAMTGAVGFRTEVFEGLVIDSGYQVIWTQKGFYRGADEKIAHLVRVGFVFNF